MSEAALQKTEIPSEKSPELAKRERGKSPLWVGVRAIASLRLTVVLFLLSLFLIFCGTLAQIDVGIWSVVSGYFRSFVAWIPFQIFVRFGQVFLFIPKTAHLGGSFPFPGGLTLGIVLLINLLAAHLVRFKLTWKRSGVLILHAGLMVMILGEAVTGQCAVESKMVLFNGETVNFVDISNKVELAIIAPADAKMDDVVVIPGSILSKGGKISHPDLPVDVEVLEYMKNSDLVSAKPGEEADKDVRHSRTGSAFALVNRSEESGVDPNQREDAPAARIAIRDKQSGAVLGTFLVSVWYYSNYTQRLPVYQFPAQTFKVGDKTYTVELRLKRIYKPYTIELKQFHHEVYPGTDIPKDYSSDIRLLDSARGEDREVKIYMNSPLRYSGETFYQSGFLAGDRGTILQVVRNPGDWMPYISCALVTLGMLIHFMIHLIDFAIRKVAS
jgi:hypothetical protein